MGPWEKYAQPAPPPSGPWAKYATAQAPAPAEQPGRLEKFARGALGIAGAGAQGIVDGVENVMGFPVDAINASPMLLNLLPGEQGMKPFSDNPVGGSGTFDDITSLGGLIPEYEPQNAAERIVGRIGEEVGAASVPVLGAVARGSRIGVEGARKMGGPVGRFVESAAANPKQFARREGMSAVTAGAGAGAAREAVSDGDDSTMTPTEIIADVLGAGAGAGALGVGRYGMRYGPVPMLFRKDRPEGVMEMVGDKLASTADGAAVTPEGVLDSAPIAQRLRTAPRVSDTVPGYQESLGDVLRDPMVQNLEYSRQSGPNAGMWNAQRDTNRGAARDAIEQFDPGGTPGQYSAAANAERDRVMAEITDYLESARGEYADAASGLTPALDGEARGQVVRGALRGTRDKVNEGVREAWSGIGGEVDTGPVAERFSSVTGGLTMSDQRVIRDLEAAIGTPEALSGGPVDLKELTTLRSELTTAARDARTAGDKQRALLIDRYVGEIDGYVDGLDVPGLDGARAATRDFHERFSRPGDPVAESLRENQGRPVVPDSAVPGKFVQPDRGQASNIDRLLAETGDAGEVRDALRDQILSDVQRRGLTARPDAMEKFVTEYGRVFEKFPDLKAELGTAAKLRRALDGAEKKARDTTKRLTSPNGSTVARYLSYGDERAATAMRGVINSRDPKAAVKEMLDFVGDDPKARQGAKQAFWQATKDKALSAGSSTKDAAGGQVWRPQSLANVLNDPSTRAVAEELWSDQPEHVENLARIADTLTQVDLRNGAKVSNSSGTPQALAGKGDLPSAAGLSSRIYGLKRGVVGPGYVAVDLLSQISRKFTTRKSQEAFEVLLDKALLDPDFAKVLLTDYNPATVAAARRSTKGWRAAEAAALTSMLDEMESEDDDEVVKAAGGGR